MARTMFGVLAEVTGRDYKWSTPDGTLWRLTVSQGLDRKDGENWTRVWPEGGRPQDDQILLGDAIGWSLGYVAALEGKKGEASA